MHHRIGGLLILAGSAGFGLLLILGLRGAVIGPADKFSPLRSMSIGASSKTSRSSRQRRSAPE
jgi:hypothetical protein